MREVTDLEISAGIRRELSGRRVDLGKLKFAVLNGVVTFTGELAFIGLDRSLDEIAVEIKFIESTLRTQRGVNELKFELENWAKNDFGKWESKSGHPQKSFGSGEGFHCPDCRTVFKFCPCCGKPLAAGLPQTPQQRRPISGPSLLKPLPRRLEPLKAPQLKPLPAHPQSPGELFKPVSPFAPPAPPVTAKEPGKQPPPDTGSGLPTPRSPFKPATPTHLRTVVPSPFSSPSGTVGPIKPFTPAPAHIAPLKPATVKPVRPTVPIPAAPAPEAAMPVVAPAERMPKAQPETTPETLPSPEPAVPDLDLGLNLDRDKTPSTPPAPAPVPEPPVVQKAPIKLPEPAVIEKPRAVPPVRPAAPPPLPKPADGDDFFDISMLPPIKPKTAPFPKAPSVKPAEDLDDKLLPPLKSKTGAPASIPEESFDDSLLPPLKSKASEPVHAPVAKKPAASFSPLPSIDDDTPLPPMKPTATISDDEIPLPPMKPAAGAPAAKAGKPQKSGEDPFASLFSEIEAGGVKAQKSAGGSKDGADDLAALDLDIMDIFQKPTAKPAGGPGKPASPAKLSKPEQPPDSINLGGFIDLDAPVEPPDKGKAPVKSPDKPKKDPFGMDDFDISKFKI